MKRHDEETREVVVTQEDFRNVDEFFNTFKIQMTPMLKDVMDKFRNNVGAMTFEDQTRFRAAVAHAMFSSEHPLLRDEAFDKIRQNCAEEYFSMQFDADMTAILQGQESSLPDLAEKVESK